MIKTSQIKRYTSCRKFQLGYVVKGSPSFLKRLQRLNRYSFLTRVLG